jgi:hypothetical protein
VRERPVALRRGAGLVPGALPPVGNTEDVAEGLLRRVWNPRVAQSNPAMKLRTLSAPMCLSTASAPVLSLWLTIASSRSAFAHVAGEARRVENFAVVRPDAFIEFELRSRDVAFRRLVLSQGFA